MKKAVKKTIKKNNGVHAPRLRIAKLNEFQLDPQNANQHTERGGELLTTSLQQRKFFRPVAAVGDNTIMAGNNTIAKASALGMNEAIVIETDGTRPIIHKRIDIPTYKTKEARRLALEDNRIAEVSLNWDNEVLQDYLTQDKEMLAGLWESSELVFKNEKLAPDDFGEYDENIETEHQCPKCGYKWSGGK